MIRHRYAVVDVLEAEQQLHGVALPGDGRRQVAAALTVVTLRRAVRAIAGGNPSIGQPPLLVERPGKVDTQPRAVVTPAGEHELSHRLGLWPFHHDVDRAPEIVVHRRLAEDRLRPLQHLDSLDADQWRQILDARHAVGHAVGQAVAGAESADAEQRRAAEAVHVIHAGHVAHHVGHFEGLSGVHQVARDDTHRLGKVGQVRIRACGAARGLGHEPHVSQHEAGYPHGIQHRDDRHARLGAAEPAFVGNRRREVALAHYHRAPADHLVVQPGAFEQAGKRHFHLQFAGGARTVSSRNRVAGGEYLHVGLATQGHQCAGQRLRRNRETGRSVHQHECTRRGTGSTRATRREAPCHAHDERAPQPSCRPAQRHRHHPGGASRTGTAPW